VGRDGTAGGALSVRRILRDAGESSGGVGRGPGRCAVAVVPVRSARGPGAGTAAGPARAGGCWATAVLLAWSVPEKVGH